MRALIRSLVAVIVLVLIVGGMLGYSVISRGVSTRVAPSWVETVLARTMRLWATPSELRNAKNPVEPSAAVIDDAMAHFADHCANCHANDGSGVTDLGRSLIHRRPTCAPPRRRA